jgi:hypothetical protein
MPANKEELELAFKIEMETKEALKGVAGIDKALRGIVNRKINLKGFDSKGLRDFRKEAVATAKGINEVVMSMSPKNRGKLDKDIKDVEHSYKELLKVTRKERQKVAKVEKTISNSSSKEEEKSAREELIRVKKTGAKLVSEHKRSFLKSRRSLSTRMANVGAPADIQKRTESAKNTRDWVARDKSQQSKKDKDAQAFVEGIKGGNLGKDMAEGFGDALSAMKGKDIFGLAKAGYKVSAGLMKGGARVSMRHGEGLESRGVARAGKGGIGNKAMGGAMKGIGKAMQSIGPLLNSLSKILPILGMVGGAIFSLVKLFLDADAAVKEMNKTVLEGAATWDTYASQGGDVAMGMEHLDDTLKTIRDQTTDLAMNLSMGTTAKEHLQFLNVLQREGVTMQKQKAYIDNTNKSIQTRIEKVRDNKEEVERLTASMAKYTDISVQAIQYSRLFGVSLDEIAQFQAEMMQELGSGLSDVSKEFYAIGVAANESGIAQNKFFAMIRGVSSDLGLYGVRVEEVTKMLGQLGKVMNPRTAEKYMKSFAQGMKGKSIEDRLKDTLMAGPEGVKLIQKNIAKQSEDMVKKLRESAGLASDEEAKALLSGGSIKGAKGEKLTLADLEKQGKTGGARSGTMIEGFQRLDTAGKQAKKGAFGASMAAENLDAMGTKELGVDKLKRLTGMSSFLKAIESGDPNKIMGARTAAGGQDQLDAYVGMERAINQQKTAILDALDNPGGNPEIINYLKSIKKYDASGTDAAREANKKAAESLSQDELWASLDKKDAKKEETNEQAMLRMGSEQGNRTMGIMYKMDNIFDALFNYIYTLLTDIFEAIKPIGGGLKKMIYKSGNKDLIKAWRESGGDQAKYMGLLAGSDTMKEVDRVLGSKDPKDKEKKEAVKESISSNYKNTLEHGLQLDAALGKLGITDEQKRTVRKGAHSSGGLKKGVEEAGLTEDQTHTILQQVAQWDPDVENKTKTIEDLGKILGNNQPSVKTEKDQKPIVAAASGATDASTSAPEAPPAQQQATAASANPGAGGGSVVTSAAPKGSGGASGGWDDPAPGAGPAGTPGGNLPTPPDAKALNEAVLSQVDFTGGAVVNSLQNLWDALRTKGIKLDKPQLEGEITNAIHSGTYLGAQDALAEYALYTATNPAKVLQNMKGSGFKGMSGLAGSLEGQMDAAKNLSKNAAGGVVTSVTGGMAQVNPAPGEGLASIGRGEKILPAGANGGGSITLNVNGIGGADLANFLKEKVTQGVHEYKRREKFT